LLDGVHDDWVEEVGVVLEDGKEEIVLVLKEVVEGAGVDVGFAEDGGDTGGVVTLLVEEAAGGLKDAVAGG